MDTGYTTIPDWMLDLGLDIYETVILAVIYGFSQDGTSTFCGSQNYLAKKAQCSRSKVVATLTALVDKGLLEKIDKDVRGVKLCEYKVCTTYTGCTSHAQGVRDMHKGCTPRAHNNTRDNIDNITLERDTRTCTRERFRKPTAEEVAEYCRERGNNIDAEEFCSFYQSKGWVVGKSPMKDWRAAVRTWEKAREKKVAPKKREAESRRPSVFEHNLKVIDEMFGSDLHAQAYPQKEKEEVTYDEQ